MFPIFHVALPLIFTEIPRIKKLQFNRFALLIGSILPDLIDKPLLLLGFGTGRYFSHNLLFVLISFFTLFLLSKKNLGMSLPFLCGVSIHLILDIPYVPFFYPFILYEDILIGEPILFWMEAYLTKPLIQITEIAGVIFFAYILIKNRLYNTKDILLYFKGNHLQRKLELRNENN
ncbi:hypothetical protein LCGC14_1422010 [marine sediment metagenome]|uniref:Metal-dependent hydrolase n=1 Tax=marine sediment metagenome TaxID=412755 RepID=A0A0F9KCC6_9ZZZZ